MLTTEQKEIWEALQTAPRASFNVPIQHTSDDTALEQPGIYAIWDGDTLLYIGCALMSRPPGSSKKRLWGLKDRLGSHQKGQISGSSLAIALWFCRISPTLSLEDHRRIAAHELNPSSLTEELIKRLEYTCVPSMNVGPTEAALYRDLKPPLNEFQEYVRKDRLSRNRERKTTAISC